MVRINHRRPRSLSFLDLPGEIRNKVYDYLFSGHVEIVHGRSTKPRITCAKILCTYSTNHRLNPTSLAHDNRHSTRPDLLRTCRAINEEATVFLYANITFRFVSMSTINNFLDTVPTGGAKAITRLELQHSTYGEPRLMEDRRWKLLHDKKWRKTCRRIAEEMGAIEQLKISLRICDWPTQLNLAADWAKPLLLLKGKDYVQVRLIHGAFSDQRLLAAAMVVAKAMTNENSQRRNELVKHMANIEDMELRARNSQNKVPKAITVLSIKPTVTQTVNSKQVRDRNSQRLPNKVH